MGGGIEEGCDCHRRNVASVDESDSSLGSGHVNAVILYNVVAVGIPQVLGKEPRPQNRPPRRASLKVLLDSMVGHPGLVGGSGYRDEDNLLYSSLAGHVDEGVEGSLSVGYGRGAQQEEGFAVGDRRPKGLGLKEVKRHRVWLISAGTSPNAIGHASLPQIIDYRPSHIASGPGNKNHDLSSCYGSSGDTG